jgi:hypothetical protein
MRCIAGSTHPCTNANLLLNLRCPSGPQETLNTKLTADGAFPTLYAWKLGKREILNPPRVYRYKNEQVVVGPREPSYQFAYILRVCLYAAGSIMPIMGSARGRSSDIPLQ